MNYKEKQRNQVKSKFYYIFWGVATASVLFGQLYVGSGYRIFARSLNRIFDILKYKLVVVPMRGFINENTKQRKLLLYMFWVVAMVAFIVPQVYTAIAYNKLANILTQPVRVVIEKMPPYQVGILNELCWTRSCFLDNSYNLHLMKLGAF